MENHNDLPTFLNRKNQICPITNSTSQSKIFNIGSLGDAFLKYITVHDIEMCVYNSNLNVDRIVDLGRRGKKR